MRTLRLTPPTYYVDPRHGEICVFRADMLYKDEQIGIDLYGPIDNWEDELIAAMMRLIKRKRLRFKYMKEWNHTDEFIYCDAQQEWRKMWRVG